MELVDRLSRAYPAIGTAEELACERLAERLVASDATAEEAHRALIRLYLNRGKANAALRQFRSFKEALQRELGVEPEDETRALIEEQRENGERPAQADTSAGGGSAHRFSAARHGPPIGRRSAVRKSGWP